jgi:hypothetical protein
MSGRSRSAKPDCTNEKLVEFGKRHYTYINQFFGNQDVRDMISAEFNNPKYEFDVEKVTEGHFAGTDHHRLKVVKDGGIDEYVCSVDDGHQNTDKDKNDNLCQSYSLLSYFGIHIPEDKREQQMAMISLYRYLITNPIFKENFKKLLFGLYQQKDGTYSHFNDAEPENRLHDYTLAGDPIIEIKDRDTPRHLLTRISHTLKQWEKYGYHYFIGNGECPPTQEHGSHESMPINPNAIERNDRSRFRGEGRTVSARAAAPERGRHESRPINPDATERNDRSRYRGEGRTRAAAEEYSEPIRGIHESRPINPDATERTTRSRYRGEGRTRAAAEEYSEPIRGRHEKRPIATERTRSRSRATAEEARRSHTMSTRAAAAEEARSGRTWMSSPRGESRSTRTRRGGNKN